MDRTSLPYERVEGKTYTLFGDGNSTLPYYRKIEALADQIIEKSGDIQSVLEVISAYGSKKKLLARLSARKEESSQVSFMLHRLNEVLGEYTEKADEHIKSLAGSQLWDPRLGTTRYQYHLYMLEIELTNRLFSSAFTNADKKIALLPHCLKDFTVECKSSPDDIDYRCRSCSTNCYENHISRLLKENQVDAYIWMGAGLKKTAGKILKSNATMGILGIACIPELVAGMRKCRKYGLPVLGLPLDANRCARWMGDFHENSVNLEILSRMIKPDMA